MLYMNPPSYGYLNSPAPHAIHAAVYGHRKLPEAIKINGSQVTRYMAVTVTEYVDTVTGEIIPAVSAARHGIKYPVRSSENVLRRAAVFKALDKRHHATAHFMLEFRNRRRGVVSGFDALCKRYAEYSGKRLDNVKRCMPALKEAGIVAGKSVVGPLFQYAGTDTSSLDHLNEDRHEEQVFGRLVFERTMKQVSELKLQIAPESWPKPDWMAACV
jgi:hypothetical protein